CVDSLLLQLRHKLGCGKLVSRIIIRRHQTPATLRSLLSDSGGDTAIEVNVRRNDSYPRIRWRCLLSSEQCERAGLFLEPGQQVEDIAIQRQASLRQQSRWPNKRNFLLLS